VILTLMMVRVI